MQTWVDEIWLTHVCAESKKLGFENLLLTFDAYAAHLTESVKNLLLKEDCDTLAIPAGRTSKCQPMDADGKSCLTDLEEPEEDDEDPFNL